MLPDLPELFLDLVCGFLSYEDVLVLRTTCKDLQKFVDKKPFTKLNLFVKKFSYYHELFYTGYLVGYPHSFHSDDLAIFASSRFKERFCNLQQLIITGSSSNDLWCSIKIREKEITMDGLNLEHLNHLKQLMHLEFDKMPCEKAACLRGKLNLPELQVASFTPLRGSGSSFELNCPKLRAMKLRWCAPVLSTETNGLSLLEFHAEEFYGEDAVYLSKHMSNLQKLSTVCVYTTMLLLPVLQDLETNKLSLPAIAEIRLEQCHELDDLDELASKLEDFKRKSRTKHIKFSFNGKPIDSPGELRKIFGLLNTLDNDYKLFNHLKDDTLLFVNANPMLYFLLSGVRLVKLCKNIELNEQMIKRLQNIESLTFRGQCKPNESTFERFAIHCKFLTSLSLGNQTVTKRLLEMMANHLVNLQYLKFNDCKVESIKPLVKFRNLETIALDLSLSRDELSFLYKNPHLEEVYFFDGIYLLRTTLNPKVYKILISYDQWSEFDTLNAMLDYYEKISSTKQKSPKQALG